MNLRKEENLNILIHVTKLYKVKQDIYLFLVIAVAVVAKDRVAT